MERARLKPLGQDATTMARFFLRAADSIGAWKWNASVGTDGDTLLGSAAIHDESREEVFVERDIIKTPQRIERGI